MSEVEWLVKGCISKNIKTIPYDIIAGESDEFKTMLTDYLRGIQPVLKKLNKELILLAPDNKTMSVDEFAEIFNKGEIE